MGVRGPGQYRAASRSSSWTWAAAALAGGPERTIRANQSVRLYAIPVVDGGDRVGTVVAGVLLAPYDETATIAFVGSVVLAIVLLAAVAVLTHWILGKALLPVSRMTDDAAAWSDHDLDQRFDQGEPYDELTQLAVDARRSSRAPFRQPAARAALHG